MDEIFEDESANVNTTGDIAHFQAPIGLVKKKFVSYSGELDGNSICDFTVDDYLKSNCK